MRSACPVEVSAEDGVVPVEHASPNELEPAAAIPPVPPPLAEIEYVDDPYAEQESYVDEFRAKDMSFLSAQHLLTHYPYNPNCPVCARAKMVNKP